MQTSFNLDKWQPISFRNLFNVEYWELEQAKLKKDNLLPEFHGKIALITGAANGIGYACSKKLLDNGCAVVGLDKNGKVTEIFDEFDNFKGIYCDLTQPDDIKKAVSFCVKEFGGIDILVSNAGIFSLSANLEMIDDEKWRKDLDVNQGYEAAKRCGLALISQLKKANGNDLSQVKSCIKLTGYVNSTNDFTDQPKVINGASDIIVKIFGDNGMHTRAAVSTNSLPLGVSVEIDAIFELN